MWRLAHGVVKTRAHLKRWRRLKVSERCAICHKLETFSHAFCECTLTPTVWAWVFTVINQFYMQPLGFLPALVFFKQGLPSGAQHAKSNALTCFVINLALNELWAARNLHTFKGTPSTAASVVSKIKSRIRASIRAAFNFSDTVTVINFCSAKLSIRPFGSFCNQSLKYYTPAVGPATPRACPDPGRGRSFPGGLGTRGSPCATLIFLLPLLIFVCFYS